jgi:hypothetical protein
VPNRTRLPARSEPDVEASRARPPGTASGSSGHRPGRRDSEAMPVHSRRLGGAPDCASRTASLPSVFAADCDGRTTRARYPPTKRDEVADRRLLGWARDSRSRCRTMNAWTPADYVRLHHQREEILMSVVVSAVAPGFNAEMYEAVTSKAMPGDQLPDGCELHIAGPVEQGWR